jgi:hypothetical protein
LTGLLLAPPVDRKTPKTLMVANACTTLAELNHYSQPSTRFEARFDTRQPSVADPERPFERCALFTLPRSPSPETTRVAASAAGLIYQEALTPMGRCLDETRQAYQVAKPPTGVSLQSIGCYRITWPRQRLLDTLSEHLAARTVQQWCTKDVAPIRDGVAEWFDEQWKKLQLEPSTLIGALELALAASLNSTVEALIEAQLGDLQADSGAGKSELPGVVPVIEQMVRLVGKAGRDKDSEPGSLRAVLEAAAKPVSKESEVKFAKLAVHFVEQPRFRIAGAEEAIRLCTERLQSLINQLESDNQKLDKDLAEEYGRLVPLLASMAQAKLFKGEKRRAHAVDEMLTWLRAWPRKRVQFMLTRSLMTIYRRMQSNAPEYLREVSLFRQRLSEIAAQLSKRAEGSADLGPSQDHPILPSGCRNLLETANRFIAEQSPESVQEMEELLQQQIRRCLRGLVNVCLTMGESGERLKELIVNQIRAFVDTRLGQHTPAEEFFRTRSDGQAAQREILLAFDEATPEPFGPTVRQEAQSVLLGITDDQHGRRFRDSAQELIPDFRIHLASSANEIVICREHHDLNIAELPQLGALAVEAIKAVRSTERISTLSRKDVPWDTFLRE